MADKSKVKSRVREIDPEVETAIERPVQRAEHKAWLAAEEAGIGDEEFIAAEVAGVVRHEAFRAAKQGADGAKIKAAIEAAYDEGLQEALRDRGLADAPITDAGQISGEDEEDEH